MGFSRRRGAFSGRDLLERGEGLLRDEARVGVAVNHRVHEDLEETLIGRVALRVLLHSQDALDHPHGSLLEAAFPDAVEQVEDGLDPLGSNELLHARFRVDAIHEEGGECAQRRFSDRIVFILEEFDQRGDGARGDETERSVGVAQPPMNVALLWQVSDGFGREHAQPK